MDRSTTNQLYIWFYFHIMQFWSVSFWILNHPSQNWLKPGQILRCCIPYSGIEALLSCRFSLPSIQTWAFSSWLNDFQGVFLKVFFSFFHMPGLNMQFFWCGMILNHRKLRLGTGRTNIFRTERWSWLWNCDIDEEHLGYPGLCGIRQFFGMKE